nr:hypothetical protein [Bacillus pacificus]MCX3303531.1 hypothetical protein [Bacillus pacificus]
MIRITDIGVNNGFEKPILLLVATLNELGVEPSKASDFILLDQE